jgi:hypothetical protein
MNPASPNLTLNEGSATAQQLARKTGSGLRGCEAIRSLISCRIEAAFSGHAMDRDVKVCKQQLRSSADLSAAGAAVGKATREQKRRFRQPITGVMALRARDSSLSVQRFTIKMSVASIPQTKAKSSMQECQSLAPITQWSVHAPSSPGAKTWPTRAKPA